MPRTPRRIRLVATAPHEGLAAWWPEPSETPGGRLCVRKSLWRAAETVATARRTDSARSGSGCLEHVLPVGRDGRAGGGEERAQRVQLVGAHRQRLVQLL